MIYINWIVWFREEKKKVEESAAAALESGAKYRDRAKERREDQNPDYELVEFGAGSFHAVAPPGNIDLLYLTLLLLIVFYSVLVTIFFLFLWFADQLKHIRSPLKRASILEVLIYYGRKCFFTL